MKRHKPPKARRQKATAPERPNAPKAARYNKSRAAREETEVARLSRERDEALEQQAATSEVLKVISQSTFDLQAVLATLVRSAGKLCQAENVQIFLYDGEFYRLAADNGFSPQYEQYAREHPIKPGRNTLVARTALEGKTVYIADALADPEYTYGGRALGGYRTLLGVPLLRDKNCIGVIALTRSKVDPFTNNQVALITNFAAQAVIAIWNTRLLNELSDSLQQQTATADVLKVISRSAFDLQTVLDALLTSACRLCEADMGTIRYEDGDSYRLAATYGCKPEWIKHFSGYSTKPDQSSVFGQTIIGGRTVHMPDVLANPNYNRPQAQKLMGFRAALGVPLVRDGHTFGVINLFRFAVGSFEPKQIEIVETFADQAVIAIENVRLFDEVQAKTRDLSESLQQQTATSEVLQVISSSSGELDPVFNKMLENATRICEAKFGTLTLYEESGFRTVALYNSPKAYADTQLYKVIRPHPESGLSAVQRTRETVHIADIREELPYVEGNANVRALADLGGARTIIIVPMLRDNELVGTITIYRQEVKPFTDKQTELVSHFANQAVIAIENARLLNELRERTQELSRSLEDLRAAQDRLVQTEKLASLGQLTAGIAHEIKNPLNFVNNFSALSVELVDEMTDVFENPALDGASRRKELDEIRDLLKSNLEKVVQHGKRADSIVKNMLLHSREGSGELRAADINGLVEESLNLAYHGARAEKSGFNITLQREFDASAGEAELFPQEITRALLNLISNGFYAATKRKSENGEANFEPTLWATTKNLGASVEIRIRDNGTGIPPEVKEKVFNPFFTTKPAGEGTGLGLSMTHDIIVKQHGGTIRVDTELDVFTEFVVTLPRSTDVQSNQRSTR